MIDVFAWFWSFKSLKENAIAFLKLSFQILVEKIFGCFNKSLRWVFARSFVQPKLTRSCSSCTKQCKFKKIKHELCATMQILHESSVHTFFTAQTMHKHGFRNMSARCTFCKVVQPKASANTQRCVHWFHQWRLYFRNFHYHFRFMTEVTTKLFTLRQYFYHKIWYERHGFFFV